MTAAGGAFLQAQRRLVIQTDPLTDAAET
jgi:hypothetical protein